MESSLQAVHDVDGLQGSRGIPELQTVLTGALPGRLDAVAPGSGSPFELTAHAGGD